MRLDSCRQCVKRRIQCDAQSPECAKCVKKGLKCSGVGLQYRFVEGHGANQVSSRSKSFSKATQKRGPLMNPFANSSSTSDNALGEEIPNLEDMPAIQVETPHHDLVLVRQGSPTPVLYQIGCRQRMLFDHFSSRVAPAMVVLDDGINNGYRSILLQLAVHDDLVQRAVSVCAAFHLGKGQPGLLESAEQDRTAIIQQLRHEALNAPSDQIFNVSAWATIIVLLVAETVTGEHEFKYLFNMLQSLVQHSSDISTQSEVHSFLISQTKLFNLLTPPFLGPEVGSMALSGDLEHAMEFIPQFGQTGIDDMSRLLKQSIILAKDIYLTKINDPESDVEPMVERMILSLVHINDQPGMHVFVWSYFIAGASTRNIGYRQFFVNRLQQIYKRTGMRNVLSTIDMLEDLWKLPGGENWTQCRSILQRTLVM